MSQLLPSANTTLRPSASQDLRSSQSILQQRLPDHHAPLRSASLPKLSAAARDDENSQPYVPASSQDHVPPSPTALLRKPSEAGLSLVTQLPHQQFPALPDTTITADAADTAAAAASLSPPSTVSKRRPAPLESVFSQLAQRRSNGTPGTSPSSSASSPALAALNDITPLPSPINPVQSPDIWNKVVGRPSSSSSASLQRDRAAGLFTPTSNASLSPAKKKVYPNLSGDQTPPVANAGPLAASAQQNHNAHKYNRSISEFVPDPLHNLRPRTVTGPSLVTPPLPPSDPQDSGTPLHREAYLARERRSVDLSGQGTGGSLPSPPQSNIETSDEDDDESRQPLSKFSPLTLQDQISKQPLTWQPLRILGNGAFSEVFLATSRSSGRKELDASSESASRSMQSLVAIKCVSHEAVSDADRMDTSIKREIEILQQISHPCLPQLYAFQDNDTGALLVMNYCAGGDLFELASQHRQVLRPRLIQRIFAELVAAVAYLHGQFIVHRDIKLENVLLNPSLACLRDLPTDPATFPHPVVTLTDLGLAKHIPSPPASALLTHPCGSIDYAAPEILLGQPYDGRATDVWALGVLLYALMEGRLPFDPLPEFIPGVDGAAARRRRVRGRGSTLKHRIARCDWLWCEFGDEDGDWAADEVQTQRGRELEGARDCVEGMLKKVGRGRWDLERKIQNAAWVKEGIRVEGGLKPTIGAQWPSQV